MPRDAEGHDPHKWLKEAKAVSVDQTAFPTFFKCRDFRRQADVEQEVQRRN